MSAAEQSYSVPVIISCVCAIVFTVFWVWLMTPPQYVPPAYTPPPPPPAPAPLPPPSPQYIFAVNLDKQTVDNAFKFDVIAASGITMPTNTTFVLAAGYTYKCMYSVGLFMAGNAVNYQWYNVTTGTYIGVAGGCPDTKSTVAVAYIQPTELTTVSLYYTSGIGATVAGKNSDYFQRGSWATIEQISNTVT